MSASDLQSMVLRMAARWGKSVTVSKLATSAADSNKPWNGSGTQTVSATVTAVGVYMPASSSSVGRLIDRNELNENISEVIAFGQPSTGEDLRDYHMVTDGTVVKRVDRWWAIQPGATVIGYVASIKK